MPIRPLLLLLVLLALLAGRPTLAAASGESPLQNELAGSPSPYLTMHAADPVHWQRWGTAAFARARREHKLIYVTSGYYACRWCHVMQHESYENPEIAALLNRDFIPVAVDRELSPALDARLIDFAERTRGQAGWPLNSFVTPEGYPLVGVTYMPPDQLKDLLVRLGARWRADREGLSELARKASAELSAQAAAGKQKLALTGAETRRLRRALTDSARAQADELQGGFGDQNKFPMVPQLDALLGIYRDTRDEHLASFLRLTLDHMADGGLHDHLAGGFFRYTVDPGWQVPHFEKMLYDNALLARLYLNAGDVLKAPAYTRIGRQTLDFMLRAFGPGGRGLAASLSAVDAHGVEGGAYLWQRAEVRKLLSAPQYRVAARVWGLDGPPALEHGYHLVQARSPKDVAAELELPAAKVQALLEAARRRLLAARGARTIPRDDKRVAAWNGLALSALVAGARRFPDGPYRGAAGRLAGFLGKRLWDGRQLHRAVAPDGRVVGSGALEDYAYVAAGLLDWYRLDGDRRARAFTSRLLDVAWRGFYAPGGWRRGAPSLLRYGAGEAVIADGPMPSPSAVLVRTSLALGRGGDITRARAALALGGRLLRDEPLWHATEIAVLMRLVPAPSIGNPPRTDTAAPR
ncbi:MAG TPA: DUF255 domain-containing protein [Gammaproteobacteria bacterium]|nr:DUF255 domain-containing protein [Gammaproteobacteria bacterium]